jgi:hypothetical protein
MSTSHRDPSNREPQRLKPIDIDGGFLAQLKVVPFPVWKTQTPRAF